LFKWLKRSAASSRILGLDMYEEGCALAVVDQANSGRPVIKGARWCTFNAAADKASALSQSVRELGARGLPVVATLPGSVYSLVQLEAPELETEELREAMRWRVKDLIDFPVEDAVIDVFELPASRRPGAPSLVYAVVAKAQEVEDLGSMLLDASLEVYAIDIAEMAIRNLALHLDKPGRPRAYLQLQPGHTIIEIADGPQVYLSRRVMQDYDLNLNTDLLQAQMENLALEVQRSLDYFESQYALGPADQLSVIVSDDVMFEAFCRVSRAFLTVQTERFRFTDMDGLDEVDLTVLGHGVTAVGAAMRGLPWAA